MGRVLDPIDLYVVKRFGAWTDGQWAPSRALLTAAIDGVPTPKNIATLDGVGQFAAGEYASFWGPGGNLGTAQIVSIDPVGLTLTFAAGALAFDAPIGTVVLPYFAIEASRPQPAGAELTDFLDEGARSTARFVIYADDDQTALTLADQSDRSADLVIYDGSYYLASSIDLWAGMPLGYRSYVLIAYAADEAPA